jgi:hypothetical protein
MYVCRNPFLALLLRLAVVSISMLLLVVVTVLMMQWNVSVAGHDILKKNENICAFDSQRFKYVIARRIISLHTPI